MNLVVVVNAFFPKAKYDVTFLLNVLLEANLKEVKI